MSIQLSIYIGIVIFYLYLIIVGIELNIVEKEIISQNNLIYNYLWIINIFYFPVVVYFIFKTAELLIEAKCDNNSIDIYTNERYGVIEKKTTRYFKSKIIYLFINGGRINNEFY